MKPAGFYTKGRKKRPITSKRFSARGNSGSENAARKKHLALTSHDIVNGVRKAGRNIRLKAAQKYISWWDVAKGYEPGFFEWLSRGDSILTTEIREFADVGFEDESFPEFMYRAYENAKEEQEDSEPSHMDYVKSPSGSLGSKTSVGVVDGEFLGEFNSEEDADAAIRDHMTKSKIYSTVWQQSDHGNNVVDTSFRRPQ